MTEKLTPLWSRIGRAVRSERATVPLAIIGVLLLVSSVMIVGYVETRENPEPDVDASLAIDLTEASMQTAVRDGSQRATEMAATQPLTSPAETDWGGVLNESDGGLSSDPFENYLRALIYLEVSDDLQLAGQEKGRVETTVSVPEITDEVEFRQAIERVDIDGAETDLTVSVANITLTATHDGEVIDERETTVEVTIATPIMQLHDRVEQYQYDIDEAGVAERGFTQRFNARTYAIAWARGWAQNYRAPVVEVLANRHIEPSANAALYRTQQDVFGAADPNLRTATRLGWVCMALKDGEAMFDEYMSDRAGLSYDELHYDDESRELAYNDSYAVEIPEAATEGLCSSAHFLLDQYTEQHPRSPSVMELIGGTDFLQENETMDVGETASLPLVEMADPDYQYSFENAVQTIFTIEGSVVAQASDATLDIDVSCGAGYSSGPISRESSTHIFTTSREEVPHDDEQYYTYESEIHVSVSAERNCYSRDGDSSTTQTDSDSYTLSVTTTVGEKEASPFAKIDEVNERDVAAEYKYNQGPERWGQFSNYDGAQDEVTAAILGSNSTRSHEQWLDRKLEQTSYDRSVPSASDFETTAVVKLDHDSLLEEFKLKAEMVDDVAELQAHAAAVTVEFDRHELVSDNPVSQLIDELEAQVHAEYLDASASHDYENVGEKALYEARYLYYLSLLEHLEALEDAHDSGTDEIESQITEVDDSLENATRYLTQGIRERESDPDAFESPELTGNVSYEVSGSPTYLVSGEAVHSDRVPPVDNEDGFAPLRTKNTNFVSMPYDLVGDLLVDFLDLLPFTSGEPDAEMTFRMAGDVLAAADLAVQAQQEAIQRERNDTYLDGQGLDEDDVEMFRENVENSLEEFQANVSRQTVLALYPSPDAACILYDNPLEHKRYPGWDDCHDIDESLEALVEMAEMTVQSAVSDALDPYDTATTASKIGDGTATEYIIENVTLALDDPAYHPHDEFASEYEATQWETFIESAVRPAVLTASATSVELGSAEDAAELDEAIQGALGSAAEDLVEHRATEVSEQIGERVGEKWVGNTRRTQVRAARVPAGIPLVPVPGKWVATVNAWDVQVAGEYARFEVTANMGTPADATGMTYVRENITVRHEIAGKERKLGTVEGISFDSRTVLLVVTPPGVGVGDRDDENPECSPTYPHVGDVDPESDDECEDSRLDDG